jgi:hypothetical protein
LGGREIGGFLDVVVVGPVVPIFDGGVSHAKPHSEQRHSLGLGRGCGSHDCDISDPVSPSRCGRKFSRISDDVSCLGAGRCGRGVSWISMNLTLFRAMSMSWGSNSSSHTNCGVAVIT